VIGAEHDVPRALEHPALGTNLFDLRGVVTITDTDDLEIISRQADSLHRLIEREQASVVVVAGPLGVPMMRAANDIARLHGCRVLAVMPSEIVAGQTPQVVWEGDAPLVQLAVHHKTGIRATAKRVIDVVVSGTVIAAALPLFMLIGLAIVIETRGPVLFRHWRVGRHGRGFHCLKFRTMVPDAERILRQDASLWTTYREHGFRIPDDADPRVTRFGRLLRRSSLDELPQLLNVFLGEMSLVGPRPIVFEELEHFAGSERLLLSVRPGITGAWAVSGRHRLTYPERAHIELDYVRQWSLSRDLGIVAKTFTAVTDYGSTAKRR
jgi:exopolysaccharide production protein ExoY